MTRALLAGLALLGTVLVTGCSEGPTCEDLDSINRKLADTEPDDPAYNDLVSDAKLASADCNS